jgi:hypothetical protein
MLDERIRRLEQTARAMTRTQIEAFGPATKRAGRLPSWRSDYPFWFQGTGTARLSGAENKALERSWDRMVVGLAFAATGVDADEPPPPLPQGASLWRRFLRWDRASAGPEQRATSLLEREMGGDVWLATVGIWNAFCSALLADRLEAPLRRDLETPWRAVIGSLPFE